MMNDEWIQWRCQQLTRAAGDGCAAVIAQCTELLGDAPTSLAVLRLLWRSWSSENRSPGLTMVLIAVVCLAHIEEELAQALLLKHAGDGARDVQCLREELSRLVEVQGIQLDTSGLLRVLNEVNRTFETTLSGSHQLSESSRQDKEASAIDAIEAADEVLFTWADFAALPVALDHTQLQTTVAGRSLSEQIQDIVSVEDCVFEGKDPTRSSERLADPIHECDEAWLFEEELEGDGSDASTTQPDHKIFTETSPQQSWEYAVKQLKNNQDPRSLAVIVAIMIGMQLSHGQEISISEQAKRDCERDVRKAINSLTLNAKDNSIIPSKVLLLRATAMYPAAVIDVVMENARESTKHHPFFLDLLLETPVLLRWPAECDTDQETHSMVLSSIRAALAAEISDSSARIPIQKKPIVDFVLGLSAFRRKKSSSQYESIVSGEELLHSVFLELLVSEMATDGVRYRLLAVMRTWFDRIREAKFHLPVSSVKQTLERVIECVVPIKAIGPRSDDAFALQDEALLLVRDILFGHSHYLRLKPDEIKKLGVRNIPALRSLLDCYVEYLEPSPIGDHVDPTSDSGEHNAESETQTEQSLWSIVWCSESASMARIATKHRQRIQDVGKTLPPATWSTIIQIQAAKMMASSGSALHSMITMATASLLSPEVTPVLEQPISIHTMNHTVRCWSLLAFGLNSEADTTARRVLGYTIDSVEKGIETSLGDPIALRCCLQVLGIMYAWLHLDPIHRQRIELGAVRVVFALRNLHVRVPDADEAIAQSRSSIARVLCSSRLLECEAIRRMLIDKS